MSSESLAEKLNILPKDLLAEADLFIDFLIYKSKQTLYSKPRLPGFLKDQISISDDFDEPLDEFKDYQ